MNHNYSFLPADLKQSSQTKDLSCEIMGENKFLILHN